MIVTDVRPGATPQGLDGTTQKFTIEANGIAFRSLIDNLYTNKVRAVIRELCSNAMDSHIDAGQTRPFDVLIPTSLDPNFSVRDYGTSLSHEDVFGLYTTIFQSSRRNSNEVTGQKGLGSKSPFAYTDSFSVKAYLNGERRVYLAHLATDGVPALTHVSTSPSDEPQGFEVTFAVRKEDIASFQREMQFVAMAYDIKTLNVQGMKVHIQDARIKGTNWAMYPNGSFGDQQRHNHFIRMGSALYPSETAFPHVGFGWITVVEIPIGTAEVTSSRDSLSYDPETRKAVANIHNAAYLEVKTLLEGIVASAKTRVEKAKVFAEYNGILDNMRGSTMVSLWADDLIDQWGNRIRGGGSRDGDTLELAAHFGKTAQARGVYNRYASQFDVVSLAKLKIVVVNDEIKTVRKVKRIRNVGNQFTYVLDLPASGWEIDPATGNRKHGAKKLTPRADAIKWIKECLELNDSQFVLLSDLPDCPPEKKARTAGPKVRRVLKPGQFWLRRSESRIYTDDYGCSERGVGEWPQRLRQAAALVGVALVWDDVFFVNDAQYDKHVAKGELPADRNLASVVKAKLEAQAKKLPIDDAQTLKAVHDAVGSYNRALPIVMAEFFPNLTITGDEAHKVLHFAEMAKIDLRNRPIVAKINSEITALIQQYPLLFQRSEPDHYQKYVNAIKATTEKR